MYVVCDREEIARVLGHASNADFVLIDTAGRLVLDEEATRRQAILLSNIPVVEMLLTVSAATGRVPLERVAARYQSMSPTGLVVTKLDEAGGLPSVLSVAWTVAWPVACVTAGQRVPEDIEELDHERLIQETFA
jgi:flagellar biosynthesis protein FlhF